MSAYGYKQTLKGPRRYVRFTPNSGHWDIAHLQHCIRPHGGLQGGVLAVLADEDLGGAVDVEVVDHGRRRTPTGR